MYILDEPSIGLHPRDNENLIKVLKDLRDLGNTVIVVEHDEQIMNAANKIIDMGPKAGSYGGEIVAEGNLESICQSESLTAKYLRNEMSIPIPARRRKSRDEISTYFMICKPFYSNFTSVHKNNYILPYLARMKIPVSSFKIIKTCK